MYGDARTIGDPRQHCVGVVGVREFGRHRVHLLEPLDQAVGAVTARRNLVRGDVRAIGLHRPTQFVDTACITPTHALRLRYYSGIPEDIGHQSVVPRGLTAIERVGVER